VSSTWLVAGTYHKSFVKLRGVFAWRVRVARGRGMQFGDSCVWHAFWRLVRVACSLVPCACGVQCGVSGAWHAYAHTYIYTHIYTHHIMPTVFRTHRNRSGSRKRHWLGCRLVLSSCRWSIFSFQNIFCCRPLLSRCVRVNVECVAGIHIVLVWCHSVRRMCFLYVIRV